MKSRQQSRPKKERSEDLKIKDFLILSKIGRGTYAKVFLARHLHDNELVALKVLKKKYIIEHSQQQHIMTEKQILAQIQHPFLMKMKASFQDCKKLYFVLEYCPGGELFSVLEKQGKLSQEHARFYAAQIVLALEHLHQHKIIYRDLKPENILIDQHGYLKLSDFGLSKILQKGKRATSICGTPDYLAPEIIKKEGHTTDVDWWSLGCLIHEMLTGTPPFYSQNRMELFQFIVYNEFIPKKDFTRCLTDFLKGLLTKSPHMRLGHRSVEDIKKHHWFASINWVNLASKKIRPPFVPKLSSELDLRHFSEKTMQSSPNSTSDTDPLIEMDNFQDFAYSTY